MFLGNKYQQHGSARCVISVTLQGTVHPYPHQTGSSENYPSSKVPTGRGYVSSQGSVILKVEDVFFSSNFWVSGWLFWEGGRIDAIHPLSKHQGP